MKKPKPAIAWSLSTAAKEFGLDRHTLTSRLVQAAQRPDADGFFTTRQICSAIFTDYNAAKVREATERADKLAMENAQTREETVKLDVVVQVWASWLIEARNAVSNEDIPHESKERVLAAMRDIPVEKYIEEEEANERG